MTDLDRLAALKTIWPEVRPTEGMAFLALWDARGRVVTTTHIAERVRDMRGDYPTTGSLRVSMKRLRVIFRAHGIPAAIIAANCIGYRLDIERKWTWEMPE